MSLQQKVNDAFKKAHHAELPTHLQEAKLAAERKRDLQAFIKKEWPGLVKPQATSLADSKRPLTMQEVKSLSIY